MTTSEQQSNGGSPSSDPELTLFAVDSHASHSATPVSNEESQTSVGPGRGWKPSYAEFDPDTSWWKTFQHSFVMTELSEPCSVTFTSSGSMRNGQLYEQPTSAHRIRVNGSTCWPTTRAAMGKHGIAWTRAETGQHRYQLDDYLAWQYLNAGGQRVSGLKVNPTWLDWLMGFPTNWTGLGS